MKALIDTTQIVYEITSYAGTGKKDDPYTPVLTPIPNSARVCQVEPDDQTFPVAEPLFWTDCDDNVVADEFYYDTANQTINPIVNDPEPTSDVTVGVQTI